MQFLKQSTSVVVRIGPAVDATDGVTPETTLTLSAADQAELLKHNGAATVDISSNTFAAITGCDGWYDLTFSTTDTNTLGQLDVVIQDSSLMAPLFKSFMVVPANIWDSWCGADYQQVDAIQIEGSDATNQINAACDTALIDYDAVVPGDLPANFADLAITATTGLTSVGAVAASALADFFDTDSGTTYASAVSGSVVKEITDNASGSGATAAEVWAHPTRVLTANTNLNDLDAAGIRTAVGMASADLDTQIAALPTAAENRTEMDSNSTQLAAIVADTGTDIPASIAALNDLDAAGVRAAVGLSTANLDTQLAALPTAAENRAEMDSNSTQLAAIVADTGTDIPASIAALNDFDPASDVVDANLVGYGSLTFETDTAQAGTAGTITLASGASSVDDFYKGFTVVLTGGTGVGQARTVESYVGSTKVATMTDNWATTPSTDSTYVSIPSGISIVDSSNPMPAQVTEITASALADLFNTDSGTTYASSVAGSVVKEITDNASGSGATAAEVWAYTPRVLTANTNLNDLDAAGIRTAVGMASADLDTQIAALPTAAENRAEMDSNSTQLAAIITDTGTDIPAAISGLNDLDAAGIRTAVGMASADLDTQLSANATHLTDIKGAGFSGTTDSLEALRDRGDAAWVTGAGGTPPDLLQTTTIATLTSQVSFTLTAGSADDNAYADQIAIITDQTTSEQKSVVDISAYTGATKTVTLAASPDFTIAVGDTIDIIAATGAAGSGATAAEVWAHPTRVLTANTNLNDLDAAGVRAAVGLSTANLDTQIAALPTAAENRTEMDSNSTQLAAIVADTGTDIPASIAALNDLDAAGVRAAVGLSTANLDTQIAALPTAAENRAEMDSNSTQLAAIIADTGTDIPTTLATIVGYLDTEIAAILADTNELQTDLANGGRLDLLIDAIKAKTDSLTFTVAGQVDSNMQSINDQTITGDGQTGTEFSV